MQDSFDYKNVIVLIENIRKIKNILKIAGYPFCSEKTQNEEELSQEYELFKTNLYTVCCKLELYFIAFFQEPNLFFKNHRSEKYLMLQFFVSDKLFEWMKKIYDTIINLENFYDDMTSLILSFNIYFDRKRGEYKFLERLIKILNPYFNICRNAKFLCFQFLDDLISKNAIESRIYSLTCLGIYFKERCNDSNEESRSAKEKLNDIIRNISSDWIYTKAQLSETSILCLTEGHKRSYNYNKDTIEIALPSEFFARSLFDLLQATLFFMKITKNFFYTRDKNGIVYGLRKKIIPFLKESIQSINLIRNFLIFTINDKVGKSLTRECWCLLKVSLDNRIKRIFNITNLHDFNFLTEEENGNTNPEPTQDITTTSNILIDSCSEPVGRIHTTTTQLEGANQLNQTRSNYKSESAMIRELEKYFESKRQKQQNAQRS